MNSVPSGSSAPDGAAASSSAVASTKLSPALFGVALLLAISVLINYVDRGTLAIAAPLLKEDLHLSPSQLGILLSAFFWTYAPFQVVSGWLVDKFDVNWLLALGLLIWSVATLTTGLLHGFDGQGQLAGPRERGQEGGTQSAGHNVHSVCGGAHHAVDLTLDVVGP